MSHERIGDPTDRARSVIMEIREIVWRYASVSTGRGSAGEPIIRLDAEAAVFCVVLLVARHDLAIEMGGEKRVDFFAELRRRAEGRRAAMRSGAAEQRDERLPVNPEVGHPIPVAKIERAEIVRLTLRGMAAFAGCAGSSTSKSDAKSSRVVHRSFARSRYGERVCQRSTSHGFLARSSSCWSSAILPRRFSITCHSTSGENSTCARITISRARIGTIRSSHEIR